MNASSGRAFHKLARPGANQIDSWRGDKTRKFKFMCGLAWVGELKSRVKSRTKATDFSVLPARPRALWIWNVGTRADKQLKCCGLSPI
jgi:hypothetical protein